ncbi:unnamed protein product [Brachionus calyciflorus]|uniref:Apple domain-containing protein n=1 Tax=Brachionus calyciflorus TaxID=104777 RepID=A0A813ZNG2_9BILA|nr:unnamed protein product [Brachionus calyciflorus]
MLKSYTFNLIIFIVLIIQIDIFTKISASRQELTWTDNTAFGCNFTFNDTFKKIESIEKDKCKSNCIQTYGCSHFVWNKNKNGTCILKKNDISQDNLVISNDLTSMCGIVEGNPLVNDVHTLKHVYINDEGACLLPAESYAIKYPIALGNRETLDYLKFRPQLCGHVLEIDCGLGKFDAVIMNSNFGGGLELYESLWEAAVPKRNKKMNEARCNVTLSKKNPFTSTDYKCYHGTDQTDNVYFRSLGLFNTRGKVVVAAQMNGRNGTLTENGYFTFYNFGTEEDLVTFYFEFGGSYSVYLKDCPGNSKKQQWS